MKRVRKYKVSDAQRIRLHSVYRMLAIRYLKLGNSNKAKEILDKHLKSILLTSYKSVEFQILELLALSETCACIDSDKRLKVLEVALDLLSRNSKIAPELQGEVFLELAHCYVQLKDYNKAHVYIKKAEELLPIMYLGCPEERLDILREMEELYIQIKE